MEDIFASRQKPYLARETVVTRKRSFNWLPPLSVKQREQVRDEDPFHWIPDLGDWELDAEGMRVVLHKDGFPIAFPAGEASVVLMDQDPQDRDQLRFRLRVGDADLVQAENGTKSLDDVHKELLAEVYAIVAGDD